MDKNLAAKIAAEGDYKEFTYKGRRCEIQRARGLGYLCGYVYLDAILNDDVVSNLLVHGGITFAQVDDGQQCIGFDCVRPGDLVPRFPREGEEEVYRDMEFVTKELKSLVDQITCKDLD